MEHGIAYFTNIKHQMKNYIIKDLTFVIPVRLDSIVRLENLLAVIRQVRKLDSKIIIIESGRIPNNIIKHLLPTKTEVMYHFVKDDDVIFYRTHFINLALNFVETPFVAVWDADVIVNDKQIMDSITVLRKEEAEVSFPYDGEFLNTDESLRDLYIEKHDLRLLLKYKNYMNILYGKNFIGGGFIICKEKYINAGKENENFYGWGPEDLDRVQRWEAMGYRIHRSQGPMFHLCHPRDMNGTSRSTIHNDICMLQLSNSRYSSQYEIQENF